MRPLSLRHSNSQHIVPRSRPAPPYMLSKNAFCTLATDTRDTIGYHVACRDNDAAHGRSVPQKEESNFTAVFRRSGEVTCLVTFPYLLEVKKKNRNSNNIGPWTALAFPQ